MLLNIHNYIKQHFFPLFFLCYSRVIVIPCGEDAFRLFLRSLKMFIDFPILCWRFQHVVVVTKRQYTHTHTHTKVMDVSSHLLCCLQVPAARFVRICLNFHTWNHGGGCEHGRSLSKGYYITLHEKSIFVIVCKRTHHIKWILKIRNKLMRKFVVVEK